MESVILMLRVLLANWQEAVIGGVILACSVIFLMGLAKKAGIGKIKNKHLKNAILYFGSIVLVFPLTAFYLFVNGINFRWYWWACLLTAGLTTGIYPFYENSGVRAFVHWVGGKTLGKWFGELWIAFKEKRDNTALKTQLAMTTAELKEEVRKEIHSTIKEDKDLKGL